jgi:hypothetical protein
MLLVGRVMKGAWHPVPPMWIGGVGFAAGVLFWLLPIIAKPFYLVWYFIACCMGFVIGNLLLSLFFYVLFTPVGLLMRAMGRRSISKGFDKSAKTYWQDAKKIEDPASYYSQF